MIMETSIYDKLNNNKVKCGICNHFCIVEDGQRGICNVRENRRGTLCSLVYGKIIARGIDPVEKKPIFHFKPGSSSYSIASVGCNFRCSFCQNSDISQMPTDHGGLIRGIDMSPDTIVAQAIRGECASIAYTYTEPAVYFEFAFDTAKLAHDKGLANIFVTNGYMSSKVIKMMAPYLDAANVDLKSFRNDFYQKQCRAKIEPVKENLKLLKSLGILVEVTTLLIPGLNDDAGELKAMANFIAGTLGVETPWHISGFHPCYKMTDHGPTPVTSLEDAYNTGKKAGLRYVYTGNAPGLESENTFCHSCGKLLVERVAYNVKTYFTKNGECPDCGTELYGIF